ncbi:MAG: hypothetical protein LBL83_01300, partial [Clostridiales bacterium]|nr:hypothetical protein [Clostridiales bacterium]
ARAKPIENGFSFYAGSLSFSVFAAEAARVDTAWFRGGWFDSFTMLCNRMGRGISENRARAGDGESPGATLSIPFSLAPGERREIRLFLSWYAPESDLRLGHEFEDGAENCAESAVEGGAEGGAENGEKNSAENGVEGGAGSDRKNSAENGAENNTESDGKNSAENGAESGGENGAENGAGSNAESGAENGDASSNETCRRDTCRRETYRPWYSGQFAGADALNRYIKSEFGRLRSESMAFSDCLFSSTLPPEILEAVAANLSILKSPTVLRQTDGRIWGWEGCQDDYGSCHGSCTHVWNYAQALCSLFPDLERGLRQTEFWDSQNDEGHQAFRASLPIGGADHSFHAAADGQLGGVIKAYREWRISGDSGWMAGIWPRVRQSLEYCISLWDPKESGALTERHHNTYDIEFYGADIMCTGFYLGALLAAAKMAESLQDPAGERYLRLYVKGRKYAEEKLFNGEYFIQLADLDGLERKPAPDGEHPEAAELFRREGPKYQYGAGCLSDGAVGAWLAKLSGLGDILDSAKLESHLMSVYRHNLKKSLARHTNPQRPGYAMGDEGGLLLCTWPNGGKPSLPFVYSDEVWTGIEYEVASHLIMAGRAEEGLEIVRICRSRYDGTARNPFNEYECGHWYARAMSSYALLRAYSGVFYDAAEKTLRVNPAAKGDFQCFFATDGGYGMAGVKDGAAFAQVKAGKIEIARIALGE